jgi:hypothetical protein
MGESAYFRVLAWRVECRREDQRFTWRIDLVPNTAHGPELEKLSRPRPSDLEPGDEIYILVPGEHFQKVIDSGKIRDSFARKVGLAFIEWNACCDFVFEIFKSLTGLDRETADAIFRRVRNDRTQRDMTLDAAKIRLAAKTDILLELQEALRQLGELASERNIAAHVSFHVHFDKNWDAKMKPSRPVRAWDENSNIDEQMEILAQRLNKCGEVLFELLVQINAEVL